MTRLPGNAIEQFTFFASLYGWQTEPPPSRFPDSRFVFGKQSPGLTTLSACHYPILQSIQIKYDSICTLNMCTYANIMKALRMSRFWIIITAVFDAHYLVRQVAVVSVPLRRKQSFRRLNQWSTSEAPLTTCTRHCLKVLVCDNMSQLKRSQHALLSPIERSPSNRQSRVLSHLLGCGSELPILSHVPKAPASKVACHFSIHPSSTDQIQTFSSRTRQEPRHSALEHNSNSTSSSSPRCWSLAQGGIQKWTSMLTLFWHLRLHFPGL